MKTHNIHDFDRQYLFTPMCSWVAAGGTANPLDSPRIMMS